MFLLTLVIHFPVCLNLKCTDKKPLSKIISFRKSGEICDTNFRNQLQETDFSDVVDSDDVNDAFSKFNCILFSLYDRCYPIVTKRINMNKKASPWMTAGIKQSIKTKNKLYKKFVKKPITYGLAYRQYRNNLTKIIKASKSIYYHGQFNEVKGNIKGTWKIINSMLGKTHKTQNNSFKTQAGITNDSNLISNMFNDYFTNIATEVTNKIPPTETSFDAYLPNHNHPRIVWNPVTEHEIKKIVSECNSTKPGPDNIPMIIIKNNINILCPILTVLCNKSLTAGVFPEIHKIGKIIPLFKNKDKHDISNYRPICMLNSTSKILEKIISTRLLNHLETNHLLAHNQFAYRHGKGTDLANVQFIKDVINSFDENMFTISVFLDLTKAFDCVSHSILLDQIKYYGISDSLHSWITSYLKNRKQYVYFNGSKSSETCPNIGVPQGSILGPLLFLIYINDINHALISGKLSLFADDANFYKSSKDYIQLIRTVNSNLKLLSKWFRANKLSLNYIKTEAMMFSRKIIYFPIPPVIIDNIPIPYSYYFKFLGLILDYKVNWKRHIQYVRSKLSSACGIMYQLRNNITLSIAKTMYYGIAYPYLNYCNTTWSSANISHFQSLFSTQKRLLRLIMKRGRMTESNVLFSQLKFLKLNHIFEMNVLIFVFKSINNLIESPIQFNVRLAGPYNLRRREQLQVPNHTSKQAERFIDIKGAKLWNNTPENICNSRTIATFKRNLKKYYLESYLP